MEAAWTKSVEELEDSQRASDTAPHLHYIEHALEGLINGSQSRCHQCGEALGTGRLTLDPAATSLCLICEKNFGLNAKFHTP
jgi:RNA polymerase-binding transcription factor DksA